MDGDDDLLTRFAGGDPEAFVTFYRRHLATVVGYLHRRTGDAELTADLAAEVFAAALVAAERYRPGDRPALAWLYGIAAHKLADSRRRGRVEASARRRLALEPLALEDADIEYVTRLADVGAGDAERALRALPSAQRDAILAHVVDERPYAEIAGDLRCSEMLVRQRVSRGLRTLRGRLEGGGR
jgi:RNA polymerase sigma factor (sigma-70 family)